MRYLICDGIIADGTGAPCFVGSVLIEDGRIAVVIRGTDTQEVQSARESGTVVVDARGGYITPGFIDIHRHGD